MLPPSSKMSGCKELADTRTGPVHPSQSCSLVFCHFVAPLPWPDAQASSVHVNKDCALATKVSLGSRQEVQRTENTKPVTLPVLHFSHPAKQSA
eukprot:6487324-Amphidinium_carterae.1